ncbi:MAG: histidine kinase [Herbinix sp.]|nr:histidine kinase [Herbinix sp.]
MSNYRRIRQLIRFILMLMLTGLFTFILITVYKTGTGLNLFPMERNQIQSGSIHINDLNKAAVQLSVEWEFYWNELLDEDDLAVYKEKPVMVKIPGIWNKLKVNGKELPSYGYGTYHLRISGLKEGETIALYIPLLSVSYEVYVEDKLVAVNGSVSSSKEGFSPNVLPNKAYYTPDSSEIDLIVHVSNYIYARAGMWHSIYIGTPSQIEQINRIIVYKDMFMVGAYLTLAIYYLSIYALRREKQSLLFVMLCIGATIRTIIYGDRVILRIFSDFPFSIIIKFEYITVLLFYPVLMLLMSRRFPKEFHPLITRIYISFGAFASIVVLITPVQFFTKYVLVAEIFLFLTIIYLLVALKIAVLRLRKNAVLMFLPVYLLLFLSFRDLLYQSSVADNPLGEVSAFGFLLFLLIESYAISYDYSLSFTNVKKLSQELLESDKLKDKIRQTEMAFLQSQIKPHFLYNSLSVIDEYCTLDPEEASRLIGSLAKYLRQSFDFEYLENSVSINRELELVRYYVDIECARFDNLTVEYQFEYQKEFYLPPLTIQPIVENAIRHGVRKKSGEGKVKLCIVERDNNVLITINDNGSISPEKLSEILNDSDKNKSVGLINIHSRLLHRYGQGLSITSEAGQGTTVSFTIPRGGK